MHGVASSGLPCARQRARFDERREPAPSRLVVPRRRISQEGAAAFVGVPGQQRLERDVGVTVERVTVCECELRALRHHVHELFFGHRSEIEAFEQRELLQGDRTRAPGSGLADGDAAKVEGRDGFDRRPPAR